MKARQPELRAIPQFDSGRWKLRLERVPVDPCRTNRAAPAISETGANNSKPVPAESFKPMITPKR
jgi:hypothetical protein